MLWKLHYDMEERRHTQAQLLGCSANSNANTLHCEAQQEVSWPGPRAHSLGSAPLQFKAKGGERRFRNTCPRPVPSPTVPVPSKGTLWRIENLPVKS
jgi:hypothetical protein